MEFMRTSYQSDIFTKRPAATVKHPSMTSTYIESSTNNDDEFRRRLRHRDVYAGIGWSEWGTRQRATFLRIPSKPCVEQQFW